MYIKVEQDEHILVRTVKGPDDRPREIVLARLGQDPELNLFLSAETGRREQPERWDGVEDFHLLQALENFKRRQGRMKPALVSVNVQRPQGQDDRAEEE